jgi:hypothetical protein
MLRSPLSSPLRSPLYSPLAARRGGVPDPAPPVNVSLPSIMGTPAVGAEVTASPGGWTGYPAISFTYQWRRGGVNISGATAQTYTIQAADYETSLTVVVSATNTEGGPVTATSPAVTVIGVAPVNTVAPVVSGGSGLGDVLTTTTGTWTGYPASFTYAYQWRRNGSNIGGATASSYTIVAGDSAASITCLVTATNAEGSSAQASNGVTAQTFSAPVISGVPTISGTAEVGQLLTASAASVTGNPTPSRTWQWLRDGSSISGATSATYTLVSADGGTDVSVRQTETNALGADDAVSAVVEVPVSGFDPVLTFGADLVTWYGNSVDDLWQAQSTGGAVTLYQDNAGATSVTALEQTVGRINDLSGNGYHLTQSTPASRSILSARFNQLLATATLATQSVTTIAASQRLTFSGAGSITLSGAATGTYSAGTHTVTTTAGTLTLTVSGSVTNADLRLSAYPSSWPGYQRVTSASDYDTVGFPARLVTDGVDDSWSTAAIDLTATNAVSVFSAFSKLSDPSLAVFYEFGTSTATNGTFGLYAPRNVPTGYYGVISRGTSSSDSSAGGAGFAFPHIGVFNQQTSIASPLNSLRISGSVFFSNTSSHGTGNYGNNSLFVGRRNNTSLPYRGDIFSLPMIVRRLATPAEITDAEKAFGKAIGVLQ